MISQYRYKPEFDLTSELNSGLNLNDKFKAVAQVEVIGKDADKVRLKINHVLIQDKKKRA